MRYPWPWCWIWAGAQLFFWLGGIVLVRRCWRVAPKDAGPSEMTPSTPRARGIRDAGGTVAENHAVTFFRPLKRYGAPRLRDLRAFVEELQPCDEVIFGLEET